MGSSLFNRILAAKQFFGYEQVMKRIVNIRWICAEHEGNVLQTQSFGTDKEQL